MRRRFRAAAALLSLGALLSGCTATGAAKSGGPPPPTVLVLANADSGGLDGAPAVRWFVDRVAGVSGGRLVVRVRNAWNRSGDEAALIRDVANGRADLGWSGTRAFDRLGVRSLRPLSVPYLVDGYPLEAAVVRDGQRRLLADVGRAGVEPLALDADALRFPASADRPLLGPDTWVGRSVRTVASRVQERAIALLGARPAPGGDLIGGLESGAIDGAEVSWRGYVTDHAANQAPWVTPDAPLWPRTVVLFASPRATAGLGAERLAWLRDAAAASSRWSIAHAGDGDAAMMRRACSLGARIAAVDPDQLRRLRESTAPLTAELRRDPSTRSALDWIAGIKERMPAERHAPAPAGCSADAATIAPERPSVPLTAPGRTGALPLGTYRYSLTAGALVEHGIAPRDADPAAGVYTWTLGRGVFRLEFVPDHGLPASSPCAGDFDVSGDRVTFTRTQNQASGDCVPPIWSATWSSQQGRLRWSDLRANPAGYDDFAAWFTAPTWRRIG